MSLVGLLATTTLITLAHYSAPQVHAAATGHRARVPLDRDHFLLILLLNRKDFGSKTKPGLDETGGIYSTSGVDTGGGRFTLPNLRDKRVGSLSVVNSVDVMRERVMLELARRKAAEDAMLQNLNQRDMTSFGKRSSGLSYLGDNTGSSYRVPNKRRLQYDVEAAGTDAEEAERLDRLLMQNQ